MSKSLRSLLGVRHCAHCFDTTLNLSFEGFPVPKRFPTVFPKSTSQCYPLSAAGQGLREGQYDDLLNFEKSIRYDERQKAALAYAEAITWHLDTDDPFWDRMYKHFSEPDLVELGCFIALTMGQQSWLRLLNIEHHQALAGTVAGMAPGFETPEALAQTKSSPDYWAKKKDSL